MKLNVRARLLAIAAGALLVQANALAQPSSKSNAPIRPIRSTRPIPLPPPGLHRCGLIREDPRTVPWMVQDKLVPSAPRRLSVSVDLSSQMPPVGNQGQQGSCTAWAIGYYQKTHYE